MARKHRIESSEGLYHVINRGNYRAFVFESDGARAAFERTLFEACSKFGWGLNAYCIMSNHFHLCIATPKGNLSAGMRWLQGTFSAQFNRFRSETGRLFQGRFKSLLVEPGKHQCGLVDYIHLNPVRAGLVEAGGLRDYRWTSFYYLCRIPTRPEFFDVSWMDFRPDGKDSKTGWKRYGEELALRAEVEPDELDRLEREMCRGWCIGESSFKEAVVKELLQPQGAVRLEKEQLASLDESTWETALEQCLKRLEYSLADARSALRSAAWKLAIASKLKLETSVTNKWLSEKLHMGAPNAVSSNCGRYVREMEGACSFAEQLRNMNYEQ